MSAGYAPDKRSPSETDGGSRAVNLAEALPLSTTATSASAAFARSLLLFVGLMFRRPSKLFRPNRLDTWAGLRQLAASADQPLSPSFIRQILRLRGGPIALILTLLPPLTINATLGFLLFTSHSLFSLGLARLPFFRRRLEDGGANDSRENIDEQDYEDHHITLQTLLRGPSFVPNHPTILSGLAGAGAGLVQGLAFTPIENIVRFLQASTTSITGVMARILRLPLPHLPKSPSNPNENPRQALKTLLSSDRWLKSPSWWTGWRWSVARDAVSYASFFAAFDLTRRAGLRVKAFFGGPIERGWENFLSVEFPSTHEAKQSIFSQYQGEKPPTPTIARIAQATTIVLGGISASLLAEWVGRPIKACQRIMILSKSQSLSSFRPAISTLKAPPTMSSSNPAFKHPNPILETYRTQGFRPFITREGGALLKPEQGMRGLMKRVGWRVAAVGPWGFGFLVWAWVGGEV